MPKRRAKTLSQRMPLTGVRVLDFTWVWAGPFCTELLAGLGADVIKVESGRRTDNTRLGRHPDGTPRGLNCNPGHNQLNHDKRSITIDLSTSRGRALVLELAAICDVVVENFAPRVLPGLGLSYADLAAINPHLVMLSMSGLGDSGPLRDTILYGNSQLALAGMGSLLGYEGGPPENIAFAHGDPVNAYHAAYAVLAALWSRARTGRGQRIELSQLEGLLCTMAEGVIEYSLTRREPRRTGNRDGRQAPHGVYHGREPGSWLSIAVTSDAEWRGLCAALGRPAWCRERRLASSAGRLNALDELDTHIAAWAAERDAHEAAELLQWHGVAAAATETIRELAADPQLQARGLFVEIDHPGTGRQSAIGRPFRLSRAPLPKPRHAPRFGEHTEQVVQELLGYAAPEVETLREAGVLR